ncbi:MAG: T9SS type A sorting domain-containing protein [Bacteroidales bacterium]
MKSKLLPFSFLIFILGFTGIILASGWIGNGTAVDSTQDQVDAQRAAEYLSKIRSNQHTGIVDPAEVIQAREQALQKQYKSGDALGLNWEEMGPDNAPGRTRTVIYDNRDASGSTLITAGVTGGLWKTTNLGLTWNKINEANQNLYITCLEQASNGTIYAGTGEGFCTDEYTYYGGLVGQGIYKSTDGDTFTLIEETKPEIPSTGIMTDTIEWAYINEIKIDPTSDRVYAATNTGLFYSDDGETNWQKVTQFYLDSLVYDVTLSIDSIVPCNSFEVVGDNIIMNQPLYNSAEIDTTVYNKVPQSKVTHILEFDKPNCTDVDIAADGSVIATFDNLVMMAPGGDDLVFTNKSGNPENPYVISLEERSYTTTLTAVDTSGNTASRLVEFEQTTNWAPDEIDEPSPLSMSAGRANVAFAPSDASGNIVYAVCTQQYGFLDNIYLSEDKGATWQVIFPGGSLTLEIFNGAGCFSNVLTVFPNDPYKILVGSINMWMGEKTNQSGYFNWGSGPISQGGSSFLDYFMPYYHHDYTFQPGSNNKLVAATNKGITHVVFTAEGVEYTQINKKLSIAQSYTVGTSGSRHYILTGTQGDGTYYVDGTGNTPETGVQIDGASGGSVLISKIRPTAFIYSNSTGSINRSEDRGQNTSFNFNPPTSNLFLTPMALWEDFNSENSRDSVTFHAQETYYQGETLIIRSQNKGMDLGAGYPFTYVLQQDSLVDGDSVRVKDIVQSKLFVAVEDEVWMTKDAVKFSKEPDWWQIAEISGTPTCISYSKDANYVYVGTSEGLLYRIANIALAYNEERASIESPTCIIATDEINFDGFSGRFITSIAVDQQNAEHIVVTLGNYGNESYVYQTYNAQDTATAINFTDITGDLPKMPVYASVIEMENSNYIILGTEYGIYTTENPEGNVSWTAENTGMGIIPVFQIKQQTVYKAGITIPASDPNASPITYPSVDNFRDIYIATYGRGVWRDETFRQPVGIEEVVSNKNLMNDELSVYPNPVTSRATIAFELSRESMVSVNVYSLTGKLVESLRQQNMTSGSHEVSLDCSTLQRGAYLVRVTAGNQVFNSKFIVK